MLLGERHPPGRHRSDNLANYREGLFFQRLGQDGEGIFDLSPNRGDQIAGCKRGQGETAGFFQQEQPTQGGLDLGVDVEPPGSAGNPTAFRKATHQHLVVTKDCAAWRKADSGRLASFVRS